MVVGGVAATLREGVDVAKKSLSSGAAAAKLQALVKISNEAAR